MFNWSGRTRPFRDAAGQVIAGSVAEAGAWRIGGVDQWVMVRGRSVDNPLLVFVHGGPGSSATAFYRAFNAPLEDAFTVVYWDQRGAGRSFNRSIRASSLTIDRFVADLDELVDRLLARFGQRRVIIQGHSWGSLIGALYAHRFPDKVSAYVGAGQVADMAASEAASHAFALAKAEARGHRKAIKQLRAIGPPPHTLEAIGVQRRWLMVMGGAFGPGLTLGGLLWRGFKSPESSPQDLVRLLRGASFSIRALWPELLAGNLQRDIRRFEVPVIFLLGRLDMQVVSSIAAAWFDDLEAPYKQLVWFENSGHMAPFEEAEFFNRVMIETVRPLAI